MTNYIFLHGINLKTKIGVSAAERSTPQILIIDIDIELEENPLNLKPITSMTLLIIRKLRF